MTFVLKHFYAQSHYAKCSYANCYMLSAFMLSAIMRCIVVIPSVIQLSVMAPFEKSQAERFRFCALTFNLTTFEPRHFCPINIEAK
jgi:hypothetical protein